MILTITLNPSVDIGYKLEELAIDTVNRVGDVSKTAGGKGINVARVLKQLDNNVAASGFIGGSLGEFIRSEMTKVGVKDAFVDIDGETRNCIAVIHDGKQTEILENGPTISEEEMERFLQVFTDHVQEVELVAISGSLPKGVPTDFYAQLLEIAAYYHTPVLLDANGALLATTLESEYKPHLIKPNEEELAELLGKKELNEAEIIEAMESVLFTEIPIIVATRGADGAIVKYKEDVYHAQAPKIDAVNAVGSGDSVIAGFASGLSQGLVDEELISYGLAMGVLNALEEKTGHINPDKVEWAINQIIVEKV